MKQTTKKIYTIALVAGILFLNFALVPVSSASGLVVCGGNEQKAVDQMHNSSAKPDPNDPKYKGTNGQILTEKYNLDLKKYNANSDAENKALQDNLVAANSCGFLDIFRQIVRIINYLIAFAAVFLVVRIVSLGAMMVLNAGNDSKQKETREGLSNAIIGFLIAMFAFALVNAVFQLFSIQLGAQFPLNPFK